MKLIIAFAFVLFSSQIFAQKYSTVVDDSVIVNFMKWQLTSDTSLKGVRNVAIDIIQLNPTDFKFPDSLALTTIDYMQNIFKKRNHLEKYFTEKDAVFFTGQIEAQIGFEWKLKIKKVFFTNTAENENGHPSLYSYSLPIFSPDKKYAIIVERYYCGVVCGGHDFNLYKRLPDNSWEKIKSLNHADY